MLSHLHLRDFVIVEELDLDFEAGMTVMTGETGAGKSIVVDALGLALGDRGGAGMVRNDRPRTEITATFDLSGRDELLAWLAEQELEAVDGECIVRRSISADGRSRAWLNQRPVPLQLLKNLGQQLVDIHGQHAHQSLLRRDVQRRILDDYSADAGSLAEVERLHGQWQSLQREYLQLGDQANGQDSGLDLLRYQVEELRALAPATGEFDELQTELKRLAAAQRILDESGQLMAELEGGGESGLLTGARSAQQRLQGLAELDERYGASVELLDSATIQLQEATSELRALHEGIELDPARLSEVEHRLDALHEVARKHHVSPSELDRHLAELEARLQATEHAAGRLAELDEAIQTRRNEYARSAMTLYEQRSAAALSLATAIAENMHRLGMPGGQFQIEVRHQDEGDPTPLGWDSVEFLVNTNPGQSLQAMNKVASGGELSRISLAVQVIGSSGSGVPTLVFDEVDVGVGGAVAESVGQQLRELAGNRQVLCITHLPQVASQGHQHMRVHKQMSDSSTHTRITPLDMDTRAEEIARMLGGREITEQTRAHAREMLGQHAGP